MRGRNWGVVMLWLTVLGTGAAEAARVALVIGNGAYNESTGWTKLHSPPKDAEAMKQVLRDRLKFDRVIVKMDLSRDQFIDAISEFEQALTTGDTAFFYYSGHGAQSGDDNWLIPVSAGEPNTALRLQGQSIGLQALLGMLDTKRTALNVVVLDACRNNPVAAGKSYGGVGLKGLEREALGGETLIGYATAPGKVTPDGGKGTLSPYTAVLVEELPKAGKSLWEIFGAVSERVEQARPGQRPWKTDTLKRARYLAGGGGEVADRIDHDYESWKSAEGCGTVKCYLAYVEDNPKGRYLKLAKAKMEKLQGGVAVAESVEGNADSGEASGGNPFGLLSQLFTASGGGEAEAEKRRLEEEKRKLEEVKRAGQREAEVVPPVVERRETYEPELVSIPGGSFQMGSPASEAGRDGDERQHAVTVKDFRIGKYEVTQGEWRAVMGSNPSRFSDCGDRCPVEQVSWNEVQDYIAKLNAKTGKKYRLPTEAEWEYAARAGTTTAYWWGARASHEYANYGKDECCDGFGLAQGRDRWVNTAPVGSFDPNPWGLYDTAGNVWEWTCSEYKDPYDGGEAKCGSKNHAGRAAFRGGSWGDVPAGVRSADRNWDTPDTRYNFLGFRLAQD